ncbi:MAG: response regulator [Opitutus sp.]|nr:response regulator [Opitutus sp.]
MTAARLPPILIADDDADDQFLLRRALQKAKVENPIVTFNDGDDLLQFLTAGTAPEQSHGAPPCLLFLDLNMPRMTGFDVLATLAHAKLGRGLKTVVVSSSSREEDVERAKRLGASEYLIKFPGPETFGRIVADALEKVGGVEAKRGSQDAA